MADGPIVLAWRDGRPAGRTPDRSRSPAQGSAALQATSWASAWARACAPAAAGSVVGPGIDESTPGTRAAADRHPRADCPSDTTGEPGDPVTVQALRQRRDRGQATAASPGAAHCTEARNRAAAGADPWPSPVAGFRATEHGWTRPGPDGAGATASSDGMARPSEARASLRDLVERHCSQLWVSDGGLEARRSVMLDVGAWMPGCRIELMRTPGALRVQLRGVDPQRAAELGRALSALEDELGRQLGCKVVTALPDGRAGPR